MTPPSHTQDASWRQLLSRVQGNTGGLVRYLLLLDASILALACVWALVDEWALFLVAGAASSLASALPLAARGYHFLSPWTLVALIIHVSCGLRGAALALQLGPEHVVERLFLLGHPPSYFFGPSLLYAFGVGVASLSFTLARRDARNQKSPPHSKVRVFSGTTPFTVVVLALLGFLGSYLYAQNTGGFSLASLSAKRTAIDGLQLSSTYQGYGQYRLLASLAEFAFWLQLAYWCATHRRHSILSLRGVWLVLLFLNASILPIYSSQRTQLAYIVVVAIAIEVGLGRTGKPFQVRKVFSVGAILMVSLIGLTSLRDQAQNTTETATVVDYASEIVVFNRNFGDMQTFSHIAEAVPTRLPYSHGSTVTSWLAAPVPRALWSEKPLIQAGPTIGLHIYGNARTGVPPGFFAEMYWALGSPVLLVASGALGGALGAADRRLYRLYRNPLRSVAMFAYAVAGFRVGGDIVASGAGSGIFRAGTTLVLVVGVILITTRWDSLRPAGSERKQYVGTHADF